MAESVIPKSNQGASILSGASAFDGIQKYMFYLASATFAASLLWFSIRTAQFSGDVDNWQTLKPKIIEVMSAAGLGVVAIVLAIWLYFSQDVKLSITFATMVALVALVLSYTAIGIAVITR